MKLQIRDLLLSVIAAVIPPLFVAIEGAMARYSAQAWLPSAAPLATAWRCFSITNNPHAILPSGFKSMMEPSVI